tara:strand:- start:984 stop:1139 length:156 start_codon:yes stop_codon:yes gene_type:complete
MEIIIQIMGMCFVIIIAICIVFTIVEYIFNIKDQNQELLKNMKELDEKNKK